ncbi:unnamed protein product [Enterobius vermicularis]|uniref:Uncharacterized protein n=1 Tax=Enterobius vermicularis TaxID=51028 RepID=A0A0N4VFS8_ENTVE|nr:unnamed protein product [Enterobius vermicularis]
MHCILVVTKLTFYEDGAIEAECNKLPCGQISSNCIEKQVSCRTESDVLSGMKWATNGQSVLLRCCQLTVPTKLYVGTDRVTLGSYYTGGMVEEKDLYGKNGDIEYDFISNMRTEQGAVRIWVYRVMCARNFRITSITENCLKSYQRISVLLQTTGQPVTSY